MSGVALPSFVDWLAARMAKSGLRRSFGVPGGGTSLDLIAALRRHGVDTVLSAREDAATIMAGVSGILAGGPGLSFTTKGPGLANAINGLASAALDRMPALLVTEAFGDRELGYLSHQVYDQAGLAAPLLRAGCGQELAPEAEAVSAWLEGGPSGPAVMFPSTSAFAKPVAQTFHGSETPSNETQGLDRAAALLSASRRPVILVGLEAASLEIVEPLRNFVRDLGAPTLCTYMAKGCIADHDPHYAGIFTGGAIEQACVGAADLIVLVGLDPVEMIRNPWPYRAPVLDLCCRAHDPHYVRPVQRIEAPLAESLEALGNSGAVTDWSPEDIAAYRWRFLTGMAAGGDHPLSSAAVVRAASEALPAQPRMTVDAGAHMFSACAFWPATAPRDVLISNGLATMGFAVPAAIAAALHEPDRGAIAMTGDGGFLMCLGELKTATETGANVIVIVFNDGQLSLIDVKRKERQLPDLGLTWAPPDFAAVARGFGFCAWRVETGTDLATSLAEAANCEGPRLIDVRVASDGYRDQLHALRG